MIHLGDITKLRGSEVPIVDVVTGGSPCQNFSQAGNRKGLGGDESVLFYHQIRLVKEMRQHDRNSGRPAQLVRPRYCVWENVPGAFSSNGGKDFQAVITEFVRIAEPEAPDVPLPDKGKWSKSGCIYDELGRWSIAWRVHDAQFWGVPQRRKRISLVADFGGLSAPEILFERKGLSGHPEQGSETREGVAGRTAESAGSAIGVDVYNQEITGDIAASLTAACGGSNTSGPKALSTLNNQSVLAFDTTSAAHEHAVLCLNDQGGAVVGTYAWCRSDRLVASDVGCCQNARQHKSATDLVVCAVDSNKNGFVEMTGTLQAREKAGGYQECVSIGQSIVRRLTPLECERLMGFPDNWTNIGDWTDSKGKRHKAADTPRYKALGNSIALPFWQYLARRISAQYERDITMASLFDGIGGFPLVFERCGAKAVWASEIEEFPMAVTKIRFKERELPL